MFTVGNFAMIADAGIENLEDLRTYRNVCKDSRNAVEKFCYRVWKRLMNTSTFNEAAGKNYIPYLDKFFELRPRLSMVRAFNYGAIRRRYEFCSDLLSMMDDIEKRISLLAASRHGFTKIVSELLESGMSVETMFQPLNYESDSEVSFFEVCNYWYPEENFRNDSEEGENWVFIDNEDEQVRMFDPERREIEETFYTEGTTVIHLACYSGNLETVKEVLKYNPSLDKEADNDEGTIGAFEFAYISGNKKIMRLLFLLGFDVNLPSVQRCDQDEHDYYYRFILEDWITRPEISVDDQEDYEMFSMALDMEDILNKIYTFGNAKFYPLLNKLYMEDEELLFSTFCDMKSGESKNNKRPLFIKYLKGLVMDKLGNFKKYLKSHPSLECTSFYLA